jgi:hypothetical protein
MARILVAQFDDFASAEAAARDLRALDIAEADTEVYQLNAPGQHDRLPAGGDQDADRGAREGDEGAMTGAAVGSVAGLALGAAAIPAVGPLGLAAGAALGAYTGSLHGAVESMGDRPQVPLRPGGVRLAVRLPAEIARDDVIAAFNRHDARSIEEAEGTWSGGTWSDFDPVSIPRWIQEPTQHKA